MAPFMKFPVQDVGSGPEQGIVFAGMLPGAVLAALFCCVPSIASGFGWCSARARVWCHQVVSVRENRRIS
jgi:hypothetical protein